MYRDIKDKDIEHVYALSDSIYMDLILAEEMGFMSRTSFAETANKIIEAIKNKESFDNPFKQTSQENIFFLLDNFIRAHIIDAIRMGQNDVFDRILLQITEVVDGSRQYYEFADYLADIIVIAMAQDKGIDLKTFANRANKEATLLRAIEMQVDLKMLEVNMFIRDNKYKMGLELLNKDLLPMMEKLFKNHFNFPFNQPYNKVLELVDRGMNNPTIGRRLLNNIWMMKNNVAFCLLKLREFDEALHEIKEILSLHLYFYLAWHTKAEILEEMGKFEEAIDAIDKAIDLNERELEDESNLDEETKERLRYKKVLIKKTKA